MSNVILRSKTVIGAIIIALGHLLHSGEWVDQTDNLVFITNIMEAVGLVITAYGARKAIAQSANGPMQVKLHWLTMVAAVLLVGATSAEPVPVPRTMNYSYNDIPENGFNGVAGDSLKILLYWSSPIDSATLGKADSTLFRVTLTKPWRWHGGQQVAANVASSRRHLTSFRDSLMLVKPAPGDSVVFRVTDFRQCRKGACSIAGMGVEVYRRSFAPPPATPNWQITEF